MSTGSSPSAFAEFANARLTLPESLRENLKWPLGPIVHGPDVLGTIGAERFVFGTGQPLRLPENGVAKLDLLDLPAAQRALIESDNTRALSGV